jgi:hypothetical protein
MSETITPKAINESSRHYAGWGVVAAAFTGVMVSFAPIVPYTFSLFLNPLHAAFGWKREAHRRHIRTRGDHRRFGFSRHRPSA